MVVEFQNFGKFDLKLETEFQQAFQKLYLEACHICFVMYSNLKVKTETKLKLRVLVFSDNFR